jgi:hypothetical protein
MHRDFGPDGEDRVERLRSAQNSPTLAVNGGPVYIDGGDLQRYPAARFRNLVMRLTLAEVRPYAASFPPQQLVVTKGAFDVIRVPDIP